MLVHCRVSPPRLTIIFAGTDLNPWVESGSVIIKCLAQQHNTAQLQLDSNPERMIRRRSYADHKATATRPIESVNTVVKMPVKIPRRCTPGTRMPSMFFFFCSKANLFLNILSMQVRGSKKRGWRSWSG